MRSGLSYWKIFTALAALLGGIVILLAVPYDGFFWDHSGEAIAGVVLTAGGLAYFIVQWRSWRRPPSE